MGIMIGVDFWHAWVHNLEALDGDANPPLTG